MRIPFSIDNGAFFFETKKQNKMKKSQWTPTAKEMEGLGFEKDTDPYSTLWTFMFYNNAVRWLEQDDKVFLNGGPLYLNSLQELTSFINAFKQTSAN